MTKQSYLEVKKKRAKKSRKTCPREKTGERERIKTKDLIRIHIVFSSR